VNLYNPKENDMNRINVKSPGTKRWRGGKGFSMPEVKEAGLSPEALRKKGVMVDSKRKSKHQKNTDELNSLKEDL
jgi:ribosomal protein L13E